MKLKWFPLTEEQMAYYTGNCPKNEYRVFQGVTSLPGLPDDLVRKADNLLIGCSGDATGSLYYIANLARIDLKDQAIDQHPFGFIVNPMNQTPSGVLIDHGNWEGRTIKPPTEAWDEIILGNFEQYQSLQILPPKEAGSIDDLSDSSQHRAFATMIEKLNAELNNQAAAEPVVAPIESVAPESTPT